MDGTHTHKRRRTQILIAQQPGRLPTPGVAACLGVQPPPPRPVASGPRLTRLGLVWAGPTSTAGPCPGAPRPSRENEWGSACLGRLLFRGESPPKDCRKALSQGQSQGTACKALLPCLSQGTACKALSHPWVSRVVCLATGNLIQPKRTAFSPFTPLAPLTEGGGWGAMR